MKTYTTPSVVVLGDIADLTGLFGAVTTQDTYLTANGTVQNQPGPTSQFACDTGGVLGGPCIGAPPRP